MFGIDKALDVVGIDNPLESLATSIGIDPEFASAITNAATGNFAGAALDVANATGILPDDLQGIVDLVNGDPLAALREGGAAGLASLITGGRNPAELLTQVPGINGDMVQLGTRIASGGLTVIGN